MKFTLLKLNIMNIWDPVTRPFILLFTDGLDALKVLAVIASTVMAIAYKIMEMVSGPQEDQMYAQKAKKVLVAVMVIFIVPTIIQVLQQAFTQ